MPDSCGKDEAAFDVKDQKGQPPPAAPEEGKAQIIFIAKVDRGDGWPEVRFGMDGTWSGATKDNSYFAVSVTPGEHHICAAKQSGHFRSDPAMVTLTAEAAKFIITSSKSSIRTRVDRADDLSVASRSRVAAGHRPGTPASAMFLQTKVSTG